MAYTYHGKSTLIALPGESQRVINANVIVIEKDYAIRKSELANVLADMAPGNKMPGTNYIIDTQPQFQIDESGFARVRLSALNLDFASADEKANFNTSLGRVEIARSYTSTAGGNPTFSVSASFSFTVGTFRYLRTIFAPSQDPNYPAIVAPTLFGASLYNIPNQEFYKFDTTFGPTKWIGASVDKVNLYEGRAYEYTVQAICAPSFIRMAGPDAIARFDLTDYSGGSYDRTGAFQAPIPAANGLYYNLGELSGGGLGEALRQEQLQSQIFYLERELEAQWRGISSPDSTYTMVARGLTSRIENLRKQLNP